MSQSISIGSLARTAARGSGREARAGRRRLLVVSSHAEDAAAFAALGFAGDAVAHDCAVEPRLASAPHRVSAEAFDAVIVSSDALDQAGLATVTRLAELAPQTPVIVLASRDEPRLAVRAIRSGAQEVLLRSELTLPRLLRSVVCSRERARRVVELRDQSLTDPLTGLCNRRGFLLLAETHARHLRRTRRQSLLLFADVDGLKRINDEAGHLAGDRALRACARALRGSLRDSDIVARYGGDEFAAVALDVSAGAALVLLPRITAMLERSSSVLGLTRPLTMSIGAAAFVCGGSTLEDVMERADRAMYRDKRRKQLVSGDDTGAPTAGVVDPPEAA